MKKILSHINRQQKRKVKNIMIKGKKKLSLALQAILDAKTIIAAAELTVKKELTLSISKKVSKKLVLNYDLELYIDLPVDNETELVDEFLNDYMTPEEELLELVTVLEDQSMLDLTELDLLLFDLTELEELPVVLEDDYDFNSTELDELLNLDDIELMVSKLRLSDELDLTELDLMNLEDLKLLLELLKIELNAEDIGAKPVCTKQDLPMNASDAMINKYLQIKKLAKHYKRLLDKAVKVIILQKRQLDQSKKYIAVVSKALTLSKLLTLKSNCISTISKNYNVNLNAIKNIIKAFDKATNKEQVKLVYETINNTLKNSVSKNTKSINLNVIGSKSVGSTKPSNIIAEQHNRFQELANLK